MPPPRRVTGEQALLFLGDIQTNLTLVALNAREYVQTVQAAKLSGRQVSQAAWFMMLSLDFVPSRPERRSSTPGTRNIFCDCRNPSHRA
jgi:hypothetical protein